MKGDVLGLFAGLVEPAAAACQELEDHGQAAAAKHQEPISVMLRRMKGARS